MSEQAFQNPNDPPPPKKSRKGLYITLGVLGLMVVLCCGGVPLGMAIFFGNSIKTDPTVVATKSAEMLTIDRPEELHPIMYMDLIFMKMAMFGSGEEGMTDMLWLMSMDESYMQNQESMKIQMEAKMREQSAQNGNLPILDIEKSGTRDFLVRDETVTFDFNECVERGTDLKYFQTSGVVTGNNDTEPVMIYIQVRAENFDEARIQEIIESIK